MTEREGSEGVPTITSAEMREVDRIMTDELGIDLVRMMENAGRALATRAREMLGGDVGRRRIVVLAGAGGNGGGGLVAARRLSLWGARLAVVIAVERSRLSRVTGQQVEILDRLRVPVYLGAATTMAEADLLIDALVGYSIRGTARGPVADLIRAANGAQAPILALDVPSGLDPDTGEARDPTIRAAATLTLALPKAGLVSESARKWVGELGLADISVPPQVYERVGIRVRSIFSAADIIPIVTSGTTRPTGR